MPCAGHGALKCTSDNGKAVILIRKVVSRGEPRCYECTQLIRRFRSRMAASKLRLTAHKKPTLEHRQVIRVVVQ